MSLRRTRPDRSFGVNIVPLVDVLIVLIFFFLITMQFRDHQRVEITPPKMEAQAGQSSDIPLKVDIASDGAIFIDDEVVPMEKLGEALKKKQLAMAEDTGILLTADEESALKYMAYVMDTARKVGLEKFKLKVRD